MMRTYSGSSKLFRFDNTGRAYTSSQGGWFSVGADYAEYMHTSDESLEPGDIVRLDPSDGKSILKAARGQAPIGVISTSPGFVGNITLYGSIIVSSSLNVSVKSRNFFL